MFIRVVQKCIAKIFLMLDANDPPKKFRNIQKNKGRIFSFYKILILNGACWDLKFAWENAWEKVTFWYFSNNCSELGKS